MKVIRAVLAAAIGLAGCTSVEPSRYAAEKPHLDLRQYFDGRLDGWGIFQNRSGEVVKRFHVRIDARWDGAQGILDEHFVYSDGSTQRRVWRIVDEGGGRYRGSADDVVGEARGEAAGNALRWRYVLRLPVQGREIEVGFDDWMFLVDDRVMLNRSVMSKFGITLGELSLSFYKAPPAVGARDGT